MISGFREVPMASVDFLCNDINKSSKPIIGNNILNPVEIPFENQI